MLENKAWLFRDTNRVPFEHKNIDRFEVKVLESVTVMDLRKNFLNVHPCYPFSQLNANFLSQSQTKVILLLELSICLFPKGALQNHAFATKLFYAEVHFNLEGFPNEFFFFYLLRKPKKIPHLSICLSFIPFALLPRHPLSFF